MDDKIQRHFSAAAGGYDVFSSLHREIADSLLAQFEMEALPRSVLDVGCGTGYLTARCKDCWPESQIVGLDFSRGMIEVARQRPDEIGWVLADARNLPFSDGHFDRLVSNLAYQWLADLSLVFAQARRVLAPGGILACTLFGYHTCHELLEALQEAKAGKIAFNRLPDDTQVRQALIKSGFDDFRVDSQERVLKFKGMQDLMHWLKKIGANNLLRQGYLGREALSKAEAVYRRKFPCLEGVAATFEVIGVYAKR